MNNQLSLPFQAPYAINDRFAKSVAYFSMEIGVDQALKTYSGGLGFLAGSHMKSAYELGQNLIGIGVLWKYGYYDQGRRTDNSMDVQFREKPYHFLQDTGIEFTIDVMGKPVRVRATIWNQRPFKPFPCFF
jgi:starch phosphorylase